MSQYEIDAAGITDPRLRAAYRAGERILRAHGRGQQNVRYMFPAAKRPFLDAFWGVVAYVDDLADDPAHSAAVRELRLGEWENAFLACRDGGPIGDDPGSTDERDDHALAFAFVDVMRRWELPLDQVPDYLAGQREAIHTHEYATAADLDRYLDTVTLLPAAWVNTLFESISADAPHLCREAVTAFQLIDFLVDLRDDLDAGRLYLPVEHLTRFGLDRDRIEFEVGSGRAGRGLRDLIRFELEIAKSHFAVGSSWPETLHPSARTFMEFDLRRHRRIIEDLERDDYEFVAHRSAGSLRSTARMLTDALLFTAKSRVVNHGYALPPHIRSAAANVRGRR